MDPQIRSQRRRGSSRKRQQNGRQEQGARRAGHLLARSLSASMLLRPPGQGDTSRQNSSTSLLRVVAYCDRACHPRTDRDTASLPGACFAHSIRCPTTLCCDFSRRRDRPRVLLSAIANRRLVAPRRQCHSARSGTPHTAAADTSCIPSVGPTPKEQEDCFGQHFADSQNGTRMQTRRACQQPPDSDRIPVPVARGLAAPRPFPAAPSP